VQPGQGQSDLTWAVVRGRGVRAADAEGGALARAVALGDAAGEARRADGALPEAETGGGAMVGDDARAGAMKRSRVPECCAQAQTSAEPSSAPQAHERPRAAINASRPA
jgi:hypothetical protein